ncbi:Rne/Rng family ribonuclease [Cellulosimicrobium sp. PMB13]|uniref:Rne/Rng family ribonuclease n=1 Tax=Cellulosimicrobium sp. PMB13 TaxID=3120158 RepID=UPI003F4BF5C2
MTLDNTSDSTADTPSTGGVEQDPTAQASPVRKTGRRRATRNVAPPAVEPAAASPDLVTDATTPSTPAAAVSASAAAPRAESAQAAPRAESAQAAPRVDATQETAAPAARRSRRATRSTTTVPDGASGDDARQTTPAATSAEASVPDGAEPAAEPAAETARAPRRAKSSTKRTKAAPTASPAVEAEPPALDVLSEFGLRAAPVEEAVNAPAAAPDADALLGTSAEPRRAKKSRRSTSGTKAAVAADAPDETAAPGDAAAAAAQDAPATEAPTGQAPAAEPDVEKKPARRSRRAKAPADETASGPATAVSAVTEEAAPASATSGTDATQSAPAPDAPASGQRARRSRRATAAAGAPSTDAQRETAPSRGTTTSETASQGTASPERTSRESTSTASAPATQPTSPVGTTGSGTPRLATTALLFQAPDPAAAPRRPRRAQSPAGPPVHHETVAEPVSEPAASGARSASEAPASDQAVVERPEPEQPTSRERSGGRATRSSRRSAGRSAGPARAAEPVADESARAVATEAADVSAELVLSGEDRAAVEEIEAIESELVAEGVELETLAFGPEDFADTDLPGTAGTVDAGTAGVDDTGDITADAEQADDDAEDVSEGDDAEGAPRRRRRRGGRGRRGRNEGGRDGAEAPVDDTETAEEAPEDVESDEPGEGEDESGSSRRRRRRRRGGRGEPGEVPTRTRPRERSLADEVTALKGSTRLEAKRQRRREGRDAGRRRQIISEAEFLARRESVERSMVVRETNGRTQIAVLEDGVLVEHYVSQQSQTSMAGNVYLGRVQNVLPSMEAAFIDVGKGRNAVLYAGEVNWDAAGLEGQPRRIEQALKSGDPVLVQVTKDPIGHKGARLTSQITLAGRYLVFVPGGGMTGISRKLPDTERNRLKKILKEVVPDGAGVIVRTAAEGASEDELRADVERLRGQWESIEAKAKKSSSAPALLQGEPDLAIRVVRDIFNDDFTSLVVQGDGAWTEISSYVEELAPDLRERVSKWTGTQDVFTVHRVDEQLAKGMDRKVWLPSGGSLVIDRTEAMTVVDVNTGKFTGSGGTLEETVTRNNLEAAEEIVRQLRLRDIGGIIVIDFIDMVLESNRDLVLRRLVECLGRDRTKHQVAEVTSLGLVQMTRKRVGQGLVEAFSETCEHCHGRGFIVHTDPIEKSGGGNGQGNGGGAPEGNGDPKQRSRRKRGGSGSAAEQGASQDAAITLPHAGVPVLPEVSSQAREAVKATLATIAAAAAHAHDHAHEHEHEHDATGGPSDDAPASDTSGEAVEDQA